MFPVNALEEDVSELALVFIPYVIGGVFFTMGAIIGTWELKDVTKVPNIWLFSMSTMRMMSLSVSWYGIGATGCYMFGALAFNVNTILGFFDIPRVVIWLPAILGSIGFVVGGLLECFRNKVFSQFKNSAGQLVSLTNAIGGLLFLVAATTGINTGLSKAITMWVVDFPYLVGSVCYLIGSIISLWMWKDEQYGLSKLPEINLGPRIKEPVEAVISMHEQYGCGRSKASQLPFLALYVANSIAAVMLLSISLAHKAPFESTHHFYNSRVMDNMLNFSLSHSILLLGSVIHHTPTARPHNYILISARVIVFFMTVLSWARVYDHIANGL